MVSPHATAGGATRVFVEEGANVKAGGLDAAADSTNSASVDADFVTVGLIDVAVIRPTAETTHRTEAYVGPRAGDPAGRRVRQHRGRRRHRRARPPNSDNTAAVDQFSFTVGAITIDTVRPTVTAGGSTQAYLGGTFNIAAGAVNFTASALDNRASSDTFSLDIGLVNVERSDRAGQGRARHGGVRRPTSATSRVTGGPLDFLAESTGHATAESFNVDIGLAERRRRSPPMPGSRARRAPTSAANALLTRRRVARPRDRPATPPSAALSNVRRRAGRRRRAQPDRHHGARASRPSSPAART